MTTPDDDLPNRRVSLGERNYQDFAPQYAARIETKPHNAYYERPATRSLLPDLAGKRALDAGCGSGHNSEWMLDQGATVSALDVTPSFVEIAQARLGDRVIVHHADLTETLPFPDESFDVIQCSLVMDYIKQWTPTFREFARVLAPGGVVVFSCGHPMADWHYFGGEDYFSVAYHEMVWRGFGEKPVVLGTYRRSLAQTLNPIAEAGLILDHLLEPKPLPEFAEQDPEGYEELLHEPTFICIRARKPA